MKTINDLQNELSILYGNILSDITPSELTTIFAFVLSNFADDFPLVKGTIYKMDQLNIINGNNKYHKIYLDDIDEDFLEIKYLLPIKPTNTILNSIIQQNELYNQIQSLEETFIIQMTSEWIQSMTSYYVPKKPAIMSDTTGSYIIIDKDCILISLCERIINVNNIPEYLYTVLRAYTNQKFVDFVLNKSFGNTLEMNNKIFQLMYNNIESDMTSSGGNEGIASVSLGGLSVSFNNKIQSYATTLNSLSNQSTSPTFIAEMDKMRNKYQTQFKRKKNIFYNYIF